MPNRVVPWEVSSTSYNRPVGSVKAADHPISYSRPVPLWELLCLTFSTFLAVSKGASQRQSIYLILRSPVAQKRAVPKEVFWYAGTRLDSAAFVLDEMSPPRFSGTTGSGNTRLRYVGGFR